MAAYIKTLQDATTGDYIYPRTKPEAIIDDDGEIQSDIGELGQIMQPNGTFTDPEPESATPQPTLEDKVNYLFYKAKGLVD